MKKYRQEEAIDLMNTWGEAGETFLFIIDFDEKNCVVERLSDIDTDECLYTFPLISNSTEHRPQTQNVPKLTAYPPDFDTYRTAFDHVVGEIKRGDSFLTNLTCRVPVETEASLLAIFHAAQAPYKLWLRNEFVCFSPEPFISIENGLIRSFPMKGTISASLPNAEQTLLADKKEAAEHATIVDLIRNDLSRIATQVRVERYRYVEHISTARGGILQTSSAIKGRLPDDYRRRFGSLLFELLPAGSITGAPKRRTVEIIREAEGHLRGYYTGVAGIFTPQKVESTVLIRFVEETPEGHFFYHAGGGITAKSNVRSEYEEVIQKIYVPLS